MIPQLQKEESISAPEITTQWSLPTRIAFRFSFVYFLLYMCPRMLGSLSQDAKANTVIDSLWHTVVPWFGQSILHISGNFAEVATGSGDELYDYVLMLLIVVISVIATAIWSWMDRKRPNYEVLFQWLRIVMRVTLAIMLMGYGCNKIFRSQFFAPTLLRYMEPYGRTSPTDLLWTQMGYSHLYSFFGGVAEMVSALLLLVPQLATLGALMGGAVMTNVLMLNLAYDVPRKILSVHMVLMALFLLLPDMRRLFDFFALNRPAQLTKPVYAFKDKWMAQGLNWLVLIIGLGTLVGHSIWSHHSAMNGDDHVATAVRGVWTVDEIVVDGVVQPPLVTDSDRWRRVIFDRRTWTSVLLMDDRRSIYLSAVDPAKKTLLLWTPSREDRKDTLTYELPAPDKMTLNGVLRGHRIEAKLTRIPLSDPNVFALSNRGFHWINPTFNWHPE